MFGIYPKSFHVLQEIFTKHSNIFEVKIYGSRAIGNFREGSDIDLTITNQIDIEELNQIVNEIEESPIPYLVDISIYDNLNSITLKEHIDRVGKILYSKKQQ